MYPTLLKSKPKFMKRIFLLLVGLISVLCLLAVPATPEIIRLTQPDGSEISLRLVGDEFYSMFVTLEGYPLLKSADGFFHYAIPNKSGDFVISSYRATNEKVTNTKLISLLSEIDKREVGDYIFTKIKERREEKQKMDTAKSLQNLKKSYAKDLSKDGIYKTPNYSKQKSNRIASNKDFKGIVLVVEFADQKLNKNYPFTTFDQLANQIGYNDYGFTGSVRDYFYDQSYGQFEPTFDVIGPITLPQNLEYYGGVDPVTNAHDKNVAELVVTACQIAKNRFGTNFSKYDQNNDDLVDMVYIIYAGYSQAQGADEDAIWPHASDVRYREGENIFDEKVIGPYACSSELAFSNGDYIDGIGTLVHEFSHILGLVDVYDVSYSGNYGMGSWDLMAGGSYNNNAKTPAGYTAYERQMVGWMKLKELEGDQDISMDYIGYTPQAYAITNTQNTNELFTLENRQPIKWDKYLSGSGLMILHINYDLANWSINNVNTTPIQGYTIVPADNIQSYNTENNDLYPNSLGNTSFSINSTPSSKFYDGSFSRVELNDIRKNGQEVELSFVDIRPQTPSNISFDNISKSGFTVSWDEAPNCTSYEIRSQTRYTSPVLIDEDFSKMTAGSISSPDRKDISPILNQYVDSDEMVGQNIFQAGGACAVGGDGLEGIMGTPLMKNLGAEYAPLIRFDILKNNNTEFDNLLLFYYDKNLTNLYGYIPLRKGSSGVYFRDPNFLNQDFYPAIVGSKSLIIDNFSIIYNGSEVPNYTDKWLGEDGITSTSTYITSLVPLTEYTVQIRGLNNGSVSEWSEPQIVSTNNVEASTENANCDAVTSIYSNSKDIIVDLNRDCVLTITNLMGQVVYKASHQRSIVTVELDKGIYMLNDGLKTYKISH